MRNIYDISPGQLLTLWLLGFALILFNIDNVGYSTLSAAIVLIPPFALVFYSIGWRSRKRIVANEHKG